MCVLFFLVLLFKLVMCVLLKFWMDIKLFVCNWKFVELIIVWFILICFFLISCFVIVCDLCIIFLIIIFNFKELIVVFLIF